MKKPYRCVVPVAFGVILSACSSQTTFQEDAALVSSRSKPSERPADVHTSDKALTNSHSAKIKTLRRQLAENAEKIVFLTAKLDEKDRQLSQLMEGDKEVSLLLQTQKVEAERDALEMQYNQLRLENDRLIANINRLENEVAEAQQLATDRQADFMALNKSFRTLDSAHFALSKDYRDLSIEQAHLKSQYAILQSQNDHISSQLADASEQALKLAGALSEARAQHQVLWDKIRVQSNVIDTLQNENADLQHQGGLLIVGDEPTDSAHDKAKLSAKITRLQAELSAQNRLISNYQSDVAKLESAYERQGNDLTGQLQSLEATYQKATQRNRELEDVVATMQDALNEQRVQADELAQKLATSMAQKETLQQQLNAFREQNSVSQEEIASLQAQTRAQADEKTQLENQVNNLIPFEGAVLSLQNQLKSELSNVRWLLPTSANLNDAFEIQLSAEVDNPVQGQTYYAELFVDSALNMMSSAEAEATLNQGQLNFRWRLTGLNERPHATMNVSVTQEVNYDGQIILRKIYRDTESVELISNDWLSKYGMFGAAILGALVLGYGAARIGRRQSNL